MTATLRKSTALAAFLVFALSLTRAGAADWPRWRGPNANSMSDEATWSPAKLDGGKALWEKELGKGYSGFAVANGRVYTAGHSDKGNTIFCFDAVSGQEVWTHTFACKPGNFVGPRSTATIDNGKAYTLSQAGHLLCQDAATGQVLWQTHLSDDQGGKEPQWSYASSVVIEGDLALVNAGRAGMAFDKATGKKRWANTGDKCGYASPVLFTYKGQRCAAMFGAKAVYIVTVNDGRELGSFPWETKYDVNAADPVFFENKLFISSGYGRGCALLDLSGNAPRKIWENTALKNHFSSSVLVNGLLYGVDGNTGKGDLTAIDFMTGAEKWRADTGFGSFMVAGGKIIYLNEKGQVQIGPMSPAGFKAEKTADVLDKTCWTPPALVNGLLYVRNDKGTMRVFDLR